VRHRRLKSLAQSHSRCPWRARTGTALRAP
jgi:hypothetical protein